MQFEYIGSSGLKISIIALGCMTFGGEGTAEDEAFAILDFYRESGGNYLDTANNYSGSEEIIGRWLASRKVRDRFVVGTKVRFPIGDGPNDVGLSRKHIFDSVEISLRKLQTEYIDIYQAHCWDHISPIEETICAFDDLITAGKVRYIGCSNFASWQIMKSLGVSERLRRSSFINLQCQYSLLCRSPEWEILPVCRSECVGFTAWSPLAAGFLSGKYKKDEIPPDDSRLAHAVSNIEDWQKLQSAEPAMMVPHPRRLESMREQQLAAGKHEANRRWQIIDAIGDIAVAHGATSSQVALAWIMTRDGVTAPIIGCRTLDQLKDNLGAADIFLTPTELSYLDDVSDPGKPYPHDFFHQYGTWR
jgi:aryl-alcohol dehydrogenase-like predicted oxidoreductase